MKTGTGKSRSNLAENSFFQYWIKGAYPLANLFQDQHKGTGIICNGPGALTFALNLAVATAQAGSKVLCVSSPRFQPALRDFLEETKGTYSSIGTSEAVSRQRWLSSANMQIFSSQTSAQIAGLYLASAGRPEAELLDRQLAFGELEFSAEAYLDYLEQIRLTQKLYLRIGYLPPAFQELNAGIFRHQELEDAQEFIHRNLDDFINSIESLGMEMTAASNSFLRSRRSALASLEKDLRASLEKWEVALDRWKTDKKTGRDGRREKKILAERIVASHREIQGIFKEHLPFGFEWPAAKTKLNPTICETIRQRFKTALDEWSEGQRQQLREEQIALNAATDPERRGKWENFSSRLTELVERINNSGLLQRPISGSANTVSRQQKVIEQLLEKFRVLQQLLPELPAFFRWQRHWFSLAAELRRIVSPLLVFPDTDWPNAFAAWYFENGMTEQRERPVFFARHRPATLPGGRGVFDPASVDPQIVLASPRDLPGGTFDLVLNFTEAEVKLASPAKTLLLCQPTKEPSQQAHYLLGYGSYLPGQAFVQQWTASRFPDWSAQPYPDSLAEASRLQRDFFGQAAAGLEQLLEQSGCLLFVQLNPEEPPLPWSEAYCLRKSFHAAQLMVPDVVAAKVELSGILPKIWAAAESFSVLVSATAEDLTEALLSDGFNAPFALAAMLRAIESIEDRDATGWLAIAAECRKRQGAPAQASNPLIRELVPRLALRLPGAHLSAHVGWRDLFLPLVIQLQNGEKWVVLPDDLIPGADTIGVEADRKQELEAAGYKLTYVLTENILTDVEAVLEGVVERILVA